MHQTYPVAQTELQTESLFNSVFRCDASSLKKVDTISMGQVDLMTMPEGWVKRQYVHLRAGADLVEYHPSGNEDIRLNSYYRGSRVSDDAARAFKACLAQQPHSITQEELKSLGEILGDKADGFDITSASTQIRNGKRVLVIAGNYLDAQRTTSKTMYVDSDGTGSAVQEISFTAPDAKFRTNLQKAEKALTSIHWKH